MMKISMIIPKDSDRTCTSTSLQKKENALFSKVSLTLFCIGFQFVGNFSVLRKGIINKLQKLQLQANHK